MADDPSDKKPKKDSPFMDKPWRAKDGSDYHEITLRPAEDRYVDEAGVSRIEVEHEVQRVQNGEIVGNGRIDMLIDNREVIDVKTHQMDGWENADQAKKEGAAFAEKINEYVDSPQVADDARGHLYMVGTRNADPEIEQAFADGAAEYGVSVTFVDDADPEQVREHIEERFALQEPVLDTSPEWTYQNLNTPNGSQTVDNSSEDPLKQNTVATKRREQMDQIKGAAHVKKSLDKEFGIDFSETMEYIRTGKTPSQYLETKAEVIYAPRSFEAPNVQPMVGGGFLESFTAIHAFIQGSKKAYENHREFGALGGPDVEAALEAIEELETGEREPNAAFTPIQMLETASEVESSELEAQAQEQIEEHANYEQDESESTHQETEHDLIDAIIEEGAIHGSVEVAAEHQNDEQHEAEERAEERKEEQQATDEHYAEVRSEDFEAQQSEAYRTPEREVAPEPVVEESRPAPEPQSLAVPEGPDLEPDDGDQGMEM